MILERLEPEKIRALAVVGKSGGKIKRSNYNASMPNPKGQWGIFWKTVDWMEAEGMVIRTGSTYLLTSEGLAMVEQATRRERANQRAKYRR